MLEIWKPLLALVIATTTSLSGTVCIRLASDNGTIWLAILGGSLWSMSGSAFVFAASSKNIDLGVASAIMSAGGILAINLIGMIWWDESPADARKLVALTLIIIAIVLLTWSSAET